jgi:anti-sigma factor RsiW
VKTPVTDFELHALVDGELPPARATEVEAWLAEHPDAARRVEAYRRINQGLCEHFDPLLSGPAPERLQLAAQARPQAANRPRWTLVASVVLALGVGVAGGWWVAPREAGVIAEASRDPAADFAQRARVAHAVFTPDQRRPVEVDGQHEEALVKWLSKRLGAPMHAPQLQGLGYALEGGRLLPGGQGPVAQFMYSDATGGRLTLYVSHEAASLPAPRGEFRYLDDGAVRTFYWTEAGFGYAITAGVDREALSAVADEVYRQLAPPDAASAAR